MGKLPDGILGPLVGTVANITGYVLNGQNVVRINSYKNPKRSDGQKENSQKMTVINEFLSHIDALTRIGFGIAAKGTTKNFYNLAVSYNKRMAIKGEYPNIEMDYPFVRFSEGSLMPAINPVAEMVPEGVKFSWTPETESIDRDDQVMILVYAPNLKKARIIRYGAKRSAGFEIIHLDAKIINEPLETYISFVNEDRTAVATSIYTGRLNG